MKTQKQQQFEDWDYHVRNNPINKLYEAAKKARARLEQLKVRTTGTRSAILDIDLDDYRVVMDVYSCLDQIISAYEQEQPEAIDGDNKPLMIEVLNKIFDPTSFDCKTELEDLQIAITLNPDLNKIFQALSEYASQQTSSKNKEIKELKVALSELIQVKDYKDKYGKDEHYLKAMPIAWENVRKLIHK